MEKCKKKIIKIILISRESSIFYRIFLIHSFRFDKKENISILKDKRLIEFWTHSYVCIIRF